MAVAPKVSTTFYQQLQKADKSSILFGSNKSQNISVSVPKSFKPLMATLSTPTKTVGLSQTFTKLKEQGKVALIPFITAGDPDLSITSEALKVLDSCGCDIIELGVPYSDPLADGPVIQAAATRSLARGTNFDSIISMLKEVVPQLSCPIALFTYYNPILKRGVEEFMTTVKDVGVHGLVVPDVPLEETEILRFEAQKNQIELVLLTTPTTPVDRMKAIVEASQGFVYLVCCVSYMIFPYVDAVNNMHLLLILLEVKQQRWKKPVIETQLCFSYIIINMNFYNSEITILVTTHKYIGNKNLINGYYLAERVRGRAWVSMIE